MRAYPRKRCRSEVLVCITLRILVPFAILSVYTSVQRIEYGTIAPEVVSAIASVKEPGLKDLLDEAVAMFKQPNPALRNDAVEKLWDALERLKTYYTDLDKRASATKSVMEMSAGQQEFVELFDFEFAVLTKIGNAYRIRHHETDKLDIQDIRHYDYFFVNAGLFLTRLNFTPAVTSRNFRCSCSRFYIK